MNNWFKQHQVILPWLCLYLVNVGEEMGKMYLLGSKSSDTPIGLVLFGLVQGLSPTADKLDLFYFVFNLSTALLTLLFCFLLWRLTAPSQSRRGKAMHTLEILLLMFVVNLIGMPIVMAGLLGVLLPLRSGLKWLALQIFLFVSIKIVVGILIQSGSLAEIQSVSVATTQLEIGILAGATFLIAIFHLIGFALGYAPTLERRTRLKLEATHDALKATQALLSASLRLAERERIAYELHQLMGCHLRELNAQLDLILPQVDNRLPVHGALQLSKTLATDLFKEVGKLASVPQQERHIDLQPVIVSLCAGIPRPHIQLRYDAQLDLLCPVLAHHLFCCIQEAITNTVKHAQASVLMLDIARHQQGIRVIIHDDGIGAVQLTEGNGLRGMRERVTQQGGQLSLGKHGGTGYGLEIYFPVSK